jgi:hypothetical protein
LRATNRRRTAAAVLAIAVHFGFILLLLGRAPDRALSSDTAMQVSLVPPMAKARPAGHPASALRAPPILHRPVQAPPPQPDTPPPVFAAPAGRSETSPPGPTAGDASAAALQHALKDRLGCANPNLAALTDAERDACEERMGQDVDNARAYPVISPKLKKVFDGTVECKPDDEWCLYRVGKGPYPGLRGLVRKKKKTDWD